MFSKMCFLWWAAREYGARVVRRLGRAIGRLTRAANRNIPSRILMGPGPSDVDPRVLKAMATPMIGHMNPKFMTVMDEVMQLLRYVFQTDNELTVAMSGMGS